MERTDDNTISDISCDQVYTGALINFGDILKLINFEGEIEDMANQWAGSWPAGFTSPYYVSTERVNPLSEDISSNWVDNNCQFVGGGRCKR